MCGVAGYWNKNGANSAIAELMAKKISSRGPDDFGVWVDESAGLALAHRRLSILDLSPAGHQPMQSSCGRYALVYNGEIYNHIELRHELERAGRIVAWRGHSDTETLLVALQAWGIQDTLSRLNGMFAFVLWDKLKRTLFLARDRMGEKPLYYGNVGGVFFFGSEIKAFTAYPAWRGEISRDSLALYMRHNYIPAPYSIYSGIFKLLPAHYLTVSDGGFDVGKPVCYWNLARIAEQGNIQEPVSEHSLISNLDSLLKDAVRSRMMADVPLGAFLSGGYDSSAIVALMQAQSMQPVKTFTIGFSEAGFNEANHAKAVANHLGTDHTELYVSPSDALTVVPRLSSIYDEPFADSSQIPTYLVSSLARKHVTVALSGDGGDELFCGYNRYALGFQAWSKLRWFPHLFKVWLAEFCRHIPADALNKFQQNLPKKMQFPMVADRLSKMADVLVHDTGEAFYLSLISHFKEPEKVVLDAFEPPTVVNRKDLVPDFQDMRDRMMYMDMMSYLPDDILVKVDRASMAVSLEARVPLLDHRLVEFAWKTPISYKYRDGQSKWMLRQVLYRYVPRHLMDRQKMGFAVPIEHWLRGPLRDWAEDLLSEARLKKDGFFDVPSILNMWNEHVTGRRRWHYHLWTVLMFQDWLSHHRNG